jgi:hypothetical protein
MSMQYLICLFLILLQPACTSQTYSKIIPNLLIEEIMDCEIHQIYSTSLEDDPFKLGKIDKVIVQWHELVHLNVDSLHLIKDIIPRETEDTLKSIPELFSEKDFKYMALQISQELGGQWKLNSSKIKFVNNCKVGCARFTIPLFNETHTKAIIYEEEVYNPIAACGLIKVYVLEHNKWMEYKSIGIWLM